MLVESVGTHVEGNNPRTIRFVGSSPTLFTILYTLTYNWALLSRVVPWGSR